MGSMVSTQQPSPANSPALLRVLLVGGGNSGEFLLNLLRKEPNIAIIGVIDRNPEAPGLKLAHQWNIPTGNDYRELLLGDVPDLVINMTGNMELQLDRLGIAREIDHAEDGLVLERAGVGQDLAVARVDEV